MNEDLYRDILGIPAPSTKDHTPYIELITKTVNGIHEHKGAPDHIDDQIADHIIYLSFLLTPPDEWEREFLKFREVATNFYTTSRTYWKRIALGLSTPKVQAATLKLLPNFDREEYFKHTLPGPTPEEVDPPTLQYSQITNGGHKARGPEHISNILPRTYVPPQETPEKTKPHPQLFKKPFSLKIAMRLCTAWRLDTRWEKLCPCAKLLLYWVIFRTYRKDTIRKIKQALANGETYFPWCLTGIDSLSKKLTYQPRSSTRTKHYKHRQIRNALRQLWDLGFIHRIFRGYEGQGAGKYHVFLNPKMSATFNQARVNTKLGATPKKRHSRMS